MDTKTMRKAARDLVVGDIWHADGRRCVVFAIEASTEPNKFLYIHSVALGFANGIACAEASPNSQLDVELPAGLTPVQAAADKLLGYARKSLAGDVRRMDMSEMRALLYELDPPKPPTLEEAINVLRNLTLNVRTAGPCANPDILVADAEQFLKRVPD